MTNEREIDWGVDGELKQRIFEASTNEKLNEFISEASRRRSVQLTDEQDSDLRQANYVIKYSSKHRPPGIIRRIIEKVRE